MWITLALLALAALLIAKVMFRDNLSEGLGGCFAQFAVVMALFALIAGGIQLATKGNDNADQDIQ